MKIHWSIIYLKIFSHDIVQLHLMVQSSKTLDKKNHQICWDKWISWCKKLKRVARAPCPSSSYIKLHYLLSNFEHSTPTRVCPPPPLKFCPSWYLSWFAMFVADRSFLHLSHSFWLPAAPAAPHHPRSPSTQARLSVSGRWRCWACL